VIADGAQVGVLVSGLNTLVQSVPLGVDETQQVLSGNGGIGQVYGVPAQLPSAWHLSFLVVATPSLHALPTSGS
jgi:hypothetical protein